MAAPRRIGIVGTFDVANFGDLLFPLLAAHELRRRLGDVELVRYSYHELDEEAWPYSVRRIERLPAEVAELELLVVGGGDLVRFDPDVAWGYGPASANIHHPTGYWLMPTLLAATAGVPVAWNAVGVVGPLPESALELVTLAVAAADYVAVRDEASLAELDRAGAAGDATIVPDTAFGIGALLDGDGQRRQALLTTAGVQEPYVIVQPSLQLAGEVEAITRAVEAAAAAGLGVLELPISPVHGDAAEVLGLGDRVARPPAWPDPLTIAETVAGAEGVVAASLHLSFVALASGVPVFRRLGNAYSKYRFLEGVDDVRRWETASELAELLGTSTGRRRDPSPLVAEQIAQLALHWDEIAGLVGVRRPANLTLPAHAMALAARVVDVEEDAERTRETLLAVAETARESHAEWLVHADESFARLASERDVLEGKFAALEGELAAARAELEVEREARAATEEHLQLVFRTKAWRATSALRTLRGLGTSPTATARSAWHASPEVVRQVSRPLVRRARPGAPAIDPARPQPHPALESTAVAYDKIRPLDLRVSRTTRQRVNLVLPTISFDYFFGGYIGKFSLARLLAAHGHSVRIVIVDWSDIDPDLWREGLARFGLGDVLDRVELAYAFDRSKPLDVSPADTFVATTWWTAHIAHRAARELERQRFVYLIQEYEPMTFPMGAFAALAEETYRFPHDAIFSTELLRDYFRRQRIGVFHESVESGDTRSISFQNAIVDVGPVSARDLARRTPSRLLFYARPEGHAARNMFELGALALAEAAREGLLDGWSLAGIGTVGETSTLELGNGARLRLLPRTTPDEYVEVLRAHDVGLSLMFTPHPSLVPIEMASAGMLVVANTYANKTADELQAISPNFVPAEPTVAGVVAGLRAAVARAGDLEARARGARVSWSRSWSESFDETFVAGLERFLSA